MSSAFLDILSGGGYSQTKSARDQAVLTSSFNAKLDELQGEFEGLSDDYLTQFEDLSSGFDPFDLQKEYDMLYEAVIQPMERNFSETVLPQLRQSYSGGGYGGGMFSGAREASEAQARSQLSMNTALLKMQGRDQGIARNFQEYDRRRSDLGLQYDMATGAIANAMGVEGQKYGATTDQIAAKSAAGQTWGNLGPRIVDSISGFMGGQGGSQGQSPGVGSGGSQVKTQFPDFGYSSQYGYNSQTGAYNPPQQSFEYQAPQSNNAFQKLYFK